MIFGGGGDGSERPPHLHVETSARTFEDRARHSAQQHAILFGKQIRAPQEQTAGPIEPCMRRARLRHPLEIILHVLAIARRNFVEHDQVELEAPRAEVLLRADELLREAEVSAHRQP